MTRIDHISPQPVTADDVRLAVGLALAALRGGPGAEAGWAAKAGPLEWDCWETAEHLADDLFSYAAQLGPAAPPVDGYVPFRYVSERPGSPRNTVFADRAAGPGGLLQVLEASGALLAAMVAVTSPKVRAYHSLGLSDPEGFAAMGVVETLVHVHDIAEGLGLVWAPPADLCDRVLARLFPSAPAYEDRWRTLLWATGRVSLPEHPRLTSWQWHSAPEGERTA
ncbi:hypothetical protein [Saccharothrix sp. ST-888]|uniref:hypothetical protein n=1 Tax=Saccharothrix sp. ST-888 TaxID=1427391 RepID=UPI0005ED129B|nr:hypothetical protein [Saccharothrix sp. ST-888]KJK58595.1 hypothetical protein UK12_09590 [Saccharothrix sp. ST-888]